MFSLHFVGCGVQFRFGPLCIRGEPFSAVICELFPFSLVDWVSMVMLGTLFINLRGL